MKRSYAKHDYSGRRPNRKRSRAALQRHYGVENRQEAWRQEEFGSGQSVLTPPARPRVYTRVRDPIRTEAKMVRAGMLMNESTHDIKQDSESGDLAQEEYIGSNNWVPIELKTDKDVQKPDCEFVTLTGNEDIIKREDSNPSVEDLQPISSSTEPKFPCLYSTLTNNIDTICRLCETKLDAEECKSGVNDVFNCNYPTKILECTSLQVKRGDLLPRKICSECVTNLNSAYSFRNVCIKTHKSLIQSTRGNILCTEENFLEPLNTDGDTTMNTKSETEQRMNKTCDDITRRGFDDDDTIYSHLDDHQFVWETESEEMKAAQPIFYLTYPSNSKNVSLENVHIAKQDIAKYVEKGGTRVLCPFCPVILDMEPYNELLLHLDSHLPGKTIYKCRYGECEDLSPSPTYRSEHEAKYHNTQKMNARYMVLCDYCGKIVKACNYNSGYRHRCKKEKSHDVYIHCDLCPFKSKNKSRLKDHIAGAHHSERVQCKLCKKEVLFNKVEYHMRSEHRPKVTCSYCNKQFLPRNIKGHLRTHTGEKPFSCRDCGMEFTFRVSLKTHSKRYHNDDMLGNTTDVQ